MKVSIAPVETEHSLQIMLVESLGVVYLHIRDDTGVIRNIGRIDGDGLSIFEIGFVPEYWPTTEVGSRKYFHWRVQ